VVGALTIEYPEYDTTLAWTELGLHVTATAAGWELSREVQSFVGAWIVAVVVLPVTWAALPVAVHPVEVSEREMVSGLVPLLVSGGSKLTVPVTELQVTLPAAIVPPASVVGGMAVTVVVVGAVVVDEVVVIDAVVAAFELEHPETTVTSASRTAGASDFHLPRGAGLPGTGSAAPRFRHASVTGDRHPIPDRTSGLLRLVHGLIGLAHQRHRVGIGVALRQRHSDACFERYDTVPYPNGPSRHAPAEALDDRVPLDAVLVAEHDEELVTAEPAHHVTFAGFLQQGDTGVQDGRIAGLVPVGVVERLEPVEIDEQDGHRLARLPATAHVIGEIVKHRGAVQQAGERIVGGRIV